MPRAMDMARVFASKPRTALFETKRLTRVLIDMGTEEALEEIGETFKRCLASEEHTKRVAEVFERLKKR